MSFKCYVKKYGSIEVKKLMELRHFPKQANWRLLKLFVNTNILSDEMVVELEELHDNYYCYKECESFGKSTN